MKVLTLTDHQSLEPYNSLYKMVEELDGHENIELYLASRSDIQNSDFFSGIDLKTIHARRYCRDFEYKSSQSWFNESQCIQTNAFGGIWLRIDQPVGDHFLEALKGIENEIYIINRPSGLLKASSKRYLTSFPELVPGIQLVETADAALQLSRSKNIVLKPVNGYGGQGLIRVNDGSIVHENSPPVDLESKAALDIISQCLPCVSMDYLPTIEKGDKRILIFNGNIIGAMLRIPSDGNWLANVAMGASVHGAEITSEEENIVSTVSGELAIEGILLFGIDTLEDEQGRRVLSEIDPVNPGGFIGAEKFAGKPLIKPLMLSIGDIFLERGSEIS